MPRVIGIEIRSYLIKAVLIQKEKDSDCFEILDSFKKYFSNTGQKRMRLEEIIQQSGRIDDVAVMFPSNKTALRYSTPVRDIRQVIEVTEQELLKGIKKDLALEGHEINHFDHFLQSCDQRDKVLLGLGAVIDEVAFDILCDDLESAAILKKSSVNIDLLAHFHIFNVTVQNQRKGEHVAILDIDSERIIVSILKYGKTLCYSRLIPTLEDGIDRTIDKLCITLISTTAWTALESDILIKKVFVSGSDKNFEYINNYLSHSNVSTHRIDIEDCRFISSKPGNVHLNEFAVSTGLALEKLQSPQCSVDLLRYNNLLRRKTLLYCLKESVTLLCIWICIIFLISYGLNQYQKIKQSDDLVSVRVKKQEILKKKRLLLSKLEREQSELNRAGEVQTWYSYPAKDAGVRKTPETPDVDVSMKLPLMIDICAKLSSYGVRLTSLEIDHNVIKCENVKGQKKIYSIEGHDE